MRILYFVVLFTICISCSKESDDDICLLPKFEIPSIQPYGNEDYITQNSDVIFNQDSFYTFHIKIPGKNLNFLDSDPIREEYTEAMLIFKNDTLSPIGLRYKGSIGSFFNYLSNGLNGSKESTKLSMKLKVNWLNKSSKFYGLKKLQFHSMNNDPSMMKERLGYWLYNEFNVKAPRCVHAKVYINDIFIGVFALVENIDGRFIDYNFNNDGNVLKDIWPLTPERRAIGDSLIFAHLKTNEEDGEVSNFKKFSLELEESNDQDLKENIKKWFDLEGLIKHMVVSHSIQHHDEASFNFKNCNVNAGLDDCFGGNIYWFSDKLDEKVYLIPWDLDDAKFKTNESILFELQQNCLETDINPVYNTSNNTISYIDKLKCGFFQFEDEYILYKNEFNQTLFNKQKLNPLIDQWKEQIKLSVSEASELYDDAVSIPLWETSIDNIKNWE